MSPASQGEKKKCNLCWLNEDFRDPGPNQDNFGPKCQLPARWVFFSDLLPPQFQQFWPSLYLKKRLAKWNQNNDKQVSTILYHSLVFSSKLKLINWSKSKKLLDSHTRLCLKHVAVQPVFPPNRPLPGCSSLPPTDFRSQVAQDWQRKTQYIYHKLAKLWQPKIYNLLLKTLALHPRL